MANMWCLCELPGEWCEVTPTTCCELCVPENWRARPVYMGLPMDLGETMVLRKARPEDAHDIMYDIREEDVREWEASVEGGIFWLENCIRQSHEAVTLADRASDMPMVIFGCIDMDPRLPADIWMVASVFGQTRANVGWYLSVDWINRFWERWPDVHCNSHVHNPVHHRWLDWLGFVRGPTRPWGVKGEDFIYFRRVDADVHGSGGSGRRYSRGGRTISGPEG